LNFPFSAWYAASDADAFCFWICLVASLLKLDELLKVTFCGVGLLALLYPPDEELGLLAWTGLLYPPEDGVAFGADGLK
jgi:hypothetical protein